MKDNLQAYNQWLCVKEPGYWHHYYMGQLYYFHEDAPPDEDFFRMVVNENDEPIKILVRGEE